MEKYKGIFTALLTPFDHNNRVNEKELEKLVKFNLNMGVTGFYVCGSTGEAFLLSTDERMQIMDVVKSTAPNATLIAHIGSMDEREATKLAVHAKRTGYDIISSVAPFYYKFSFKEIQRYYCRLADVSNAPMLVYHIPSFSGVNMGMNEMSQFLKDDRFLGIKYTSNDFFTMEQCKSNFPQKIVYNGFDEMFLAGLSMGADGAIGSTYNFMANKFVEMKRLFDAGDMDAAKALQRQANHIITRLCQMGVMQAEKEILNQLGFDFGVCRHPFRALDPNEKEIIAREIIPFVQNGAI